MYTTLSDDLRKAAEEKLSAALVDPEFWTWLDSLTSNGQTCPHAIQPKMLVVDKDTGHKYYVATYEKAYDSYRLISLNRLLFSWARRDYTVHAARPSFPMSWNYMCNKFSVDSKFGLYKILKRGFYEKTIV